MNGLFDQAASEFIRNTLLSRNSDIATFLVPHVSNTSYYVGITLPKDVA